MTAPVDGPAIVDACLGAGFTAAGIASPEASAFGDELHAWIAEGKHGSMAWLAEHADVRADPAKFVERVRSVVMVADLYVTRTDNQDPPLTPGRGRIARYARGRDYHDVIKKRLHALCDKLRDRYPHETFRAFVDTAPVLERELAMRAGLGWTGKHTLTINPRLGSYMLLGGIATTLEITRPADQPVITDHCGTCTRCIDACPTDAITPYSVDARRCISYLTIERREPIDPSLMQRMGDWLFGCDICQEVCPHNSPRDNAAEPNDAYASQRASFDLHEVLQWTEADRRDALKGSAMKRGKLDMWRRNALIALANQGNHEAARSVQNDESALVRETARAIMARLEKPRERS